MTVPPRSPTVVDMAVLVLIVVGAVAAVRAGGGAVVTDSWILTVAAALVSGFVFGLPIVAFSLERGRATAAWLGGLGAVAGVLPLLILGLSGVIGLLVRSGGWDRVSWALERGMPIPAAGVIYWQRFLRLEAQGLLVGLTAALMFWLVVVRATPESRAVNVLLALFALATLTTVSALLR